MLYFFPSWMDQNTRSMTCFSTAYKILVRINEVRFRRSVHALKLCQWWRCVTRCNESSPILPINVSVTIDIMLNFDGHVDPELHLSVRCLCVNTPLESRIICFQSFLLSYKKNWYTVRTYKTAIRTICQPAVDYCFFRRKDLCEGKQETWKFLSNNPLAGGGGGGGVCKNTGGSFEVKLPIVRANGLWIVPCHTCTRILI